jgi:hypothetical protein
MQNWTIDALSRNVHRINLELPTKASRFRVLIQTDVHWDNPHCDQDLFRAHLDEAKQVGAPVLDFGDFFCCMQGKYDKRHSKSDVRPEHMGSNYLDRLISTAAAELRPYHSIMAVRGLGNHETAIRKAHETDLTERLVNQLRAEGCTTAHAGGYSGWVRFCIKYNCGTRTSFDLWYHHGYGGGGPVTRGTIQTSRQAVYVPTADIVCNGHTHDAWVMPIAQVRLSRECKLERKMQVHVRTPGYKEEYGDGHGGWHSERGGPPKPLGAAWVEFYTDRAGKVAFEVREAK